MKDLLINLDRRWVYVFVFLGVAVPLLFPFPLPVQVSDNTRAAYDTMERIAGKENATVLISFDYGPSSMPETSSSPSAA